MDFQKSKSGDESPHSKPECFPYRECISRAAEWKARPAKSLRPLRQVAELDQELVQLGQRFLVVFAAAAAVVEETVGLAFVADEPALVARNLHGLGEQLDRLVG